QDRKRHGAHQSSARKSRRVRARASAHARTTGYASGGFRRQQNANHQREEGRALDERRRNDHRGPDVTGGGRLTRGALHGGLSETADAVASTEDGKTSADTGGEEGKAKGKSVHGDSSERVGENPGILSGDARTFR